MVQIKTGFTVYIHVPVTYPCCQFVDINFGHTSGFTDKLITVTLTNMNNIIAI